MATHPSILAWRIPWREEPGRLESMGSQRIGYNGAAHTHTKTHIRGRKISPKVLCDHVNKQGLAQACGFALSFLKKLQCS